MLNPPAQFQCSDSIQVLNSANSMTILHVVRYMAFKTVSGSVHWLEFPIRDDMALEILLLSNFLDI
jgi:hypothetical protein